MRKIKHILALILTICFVLGMIPGRAFAAAGIDDLGDHDTIFSAKVVARIPRFMEKSEKYKFEELTSLNPHEYYVAKFNWYKAETADEVYLFYEGKYDLEIELEAAPGYEFVPGAKFYINGQEAYVNFNTGPYAQIVLYGIEIKDIWPFEDVSQEYPGADEIRYMYTNGIIGGFSEDPETGLIKYKPDKPVTRAQFAIMMYKTAVYQGVLDSEDQFYWRNYTGQLFSDVPVKYTEEYAAIAWAAKNKVISGYEGGTFKPTKNITREQINIMLQRYAYTFNAGMCEPTKEEFIPSSGAVAAFKNKYTDSEAVQNLNAMMWSNAYEIMSGKVKKDGTPYIDPKGNATRAQSAMFLARYLYYLEPKG